MSLCVTEQCEIQGCNILAVTQDLVPPTTVKVFKTSAWPEPSDCMGQAAVKAHLGRKSHVAQLNAAGKHIASMHGWEVRFIPAQCSCCSEDMYTTIRGSSQLNSAAFMYVWGLCLGLRCHHATVQNEGKIEKARSDLGHASCAC